MPLDRRRSSCPGDFWPSQRQEQVLHAALSSGGIAVNAWRQIRANVAAGDLEEGSRNLLPLVGDNVRRQGVDDPVLAYCDRARGDARVRNETLFRAAADAAGALGRHGIPVIALKGWALVAGAYRGGVDWDRLVAQAARCPFTLKMSHALDYLRTTFAAPIPDGVLREVSSLPIGLFERVEYRVRSRKRRVFRALLVHACKYLRIRKGAGQSPRLSPGEYFQAIWGLESVRQVPHEALRRATSHLRKGRFG